MKHHEALAHLYLNDKLVGIVQLTGSDHSWHFGEFEPNEAFSEFAPLFGRWSLLMHADEAEPGDRLTDAASQELRETEFAIDRIHARLHVLLTDNWREARQVNIDGKLIDWKE